MNLNITKYQEGLVLKIDKPLGWTSFDVIKKIRVTLKYNKIGHAGTLDPLASGLLIVCTGKFTKRIHEFQECDKEYEGSFTIGKTTPSHDLETEFISNKNIENITNEKIMKTAISFLGKQDQIPPKFSAIKVNGERAYKKARKNKTINLKPRTIKINTFKIASIDLPKINFVINCSKGTYIRSIARDFGKKLGVGAFLSNLRRTKIGKISIKDSLTIEKAVQEIKSDLYENI